MRDGKGEGSETYIWMLRGEKTIRSVMSIRATQKPSPNIQRYYTIKGNLLKSVDEWKEAAKCLEKRLI
ncbi:MAG: hypothetical protein LUQ38_08450 [Methanotrichaceae archaeon]|nr:hypothetical protein [Methanotrichaceae archaeon]